MDSAVESNGNAVIGISYQCAPGLGAELSVTVRETPFLGSGINGTTLAPATCVGLPQSTSVTVNPVQLLGDSAKFQSGSITDVTVTVLNLTISSPAATTKKRFAHLG
ncbi:conserved hypothetical protein [Nocardia seriolae]|nr:conserved hypothetical protein [Nocardia seriolae]